MTAILAPRKTAATLTAAATATAGYHTPADATGGGFTITLPTGKSEGAHLSIEKTDSTTNVVTVSGNIRGVAATIPLNYQYETLELIAQASGTWRVISNHLPKAAVDKKIADQAASDLATYSPLQTVAAVSTAATGLLSADTVSPVDATGAAATRTLPTPQRVGQRIVVEKVDSSANTVAVSGTIRGAAGTVTLYWQFETIELVAESLASWRPVAGHKTKTALDGAYASLTALAAKQASLTVTVPNPSGTQADDSIIATALAAGTGGTVLFPSTGVPYMINAPINVPAGTRLVGHNTQIRGGSAPTGALNTSGRHFTLAGDGASLTGFVFVNPVAAFAASDFVIAAVYVSAARCTVRQNTFSGTGVRGILVTGTTATDNRIIENVLTGGGNIVYSYAGACRTVAAKNLISQAIGNAMSGVGNSSGWNDDCIVEDNTLIAPGRMGIEDQQNTRGTIIRGNIITSPGTSDTTNGFGISAVGAQPILAENRITDFNKYGIETTGSGAVVVGNRIRQAAAALVHTGDAIIVNSHGNGAQIGASLTSNYIENPGNGIRLYGTHGDVSAVGNVVVDPNNDAFHADTDDTLSSLTATANLILFTTPNSGTRLRCGFQLYTPSSGNKYAKIIGNTIRYLSSASGGTSSNPEYLVKVGTDYVTIAQNTFDAGSITNSGGVPTIAGAGASNVGLLISKNTFLNGATYSLTGFTAPVADQNMVSGTREQLVKGLTYTSGLSVDKPATSGTVSLTVNGRNDSDALQVLNNNGTSVLKVSSNGNTIAQYLQSQYGYSFNGNATFSPDGSIGVAMGTGHVFKTGRAVTGSRPSAGTAGQGAQFFDTTLNKPIWSDGSNWRDASGATV